MADSNVATGSWESNSPKDKFQPCPLLKTPFKWAIYPMLSFCQWQTTLLEDSTWAENRKGKSRQENVQDVFRAKNTLAAEKVCPAISITNFLGLDQGRSEATTVILVWLSLKQGKYCRMARTTHFALAFSIAGVRVNASRHCFYVLFSARMATKSSFWEPSLPWAAKVMVLFRCHLSRHQSPWTTKPSSLPSMTTTNKHNFKASAAQFYYYEKT